MPPNLENHVYRNTIRYTIQIQYEPHLHYVYCIQIMFGMRRLCGLSLLLMVSVVSAKDTTSTGKQTTRQLRSSDNIQALHTHSSKKSPKKAKKSKCRVSKKKGKIIKMPKGSKSDHDPEDCDDPPYAPSSNPVSLPTFTSSSPTISPIPLLSPAKAPVRSSSSANPTLIASQTPSTLFPTSNPSVLSSKSPTSIPTDYPSQSPSSSPTSPPTSTPTPSPTVRPSRTPTSSPTSKPTVVPSQSPTTSSPTINPTSTPTSSQLPTISQAPSQYDCASEAGRAHDVQMIVSDLSEEEYLLPGSPQGLAFEWLLNVDTSNACDTSNSLTVSTIMQIMHIMIVRCHLHFMK